MYTGFGQDPRRETGLSVVYRFDFFGRTHEKKYIYIYICMNFDVGFNSTSLKVFEVPMMRDI